ncbi:helix-turn-helix transcriptional regulator [Lawsonibacter sp. LCP25S3_G6]|uniref:helix-turn-helix transcriptional regulator n=1 Tax=unclassified Lawsonibacter TaxID=2617946 RepID=UPI003F978600
MDYITVRQAAEKWNISLRLAQKFCTEGRIPGARKFGSTWAIPADADRPGDLRRTKKEPAAAPPVQAQSFSMMPLMNTSFMPGQCRETVEAMEDGPQKDMAWAEYYYFSAQAERAAQAAELYLTSRDLGLRLSACWIYGYANLTTGQIRKARHALETVQRTLTEGENLSPNLRAAVSFVAAGAAVLLHLPLPEGLPSTREFLPLLPPGLRAFALYVQAHYLYLQEDYAKSAGVAEAALAMGAEAYPIPAIYLHLVAVMDDMRLRQLPQAQDHLLAAWALARPDDLIEGFGEHHGLMGGMLESAFKENWPEDLRRILDVTYRFSWGWRRIHNPDTGHDVADNLTTTEFAVAMLTAQGWTGREIAAHMNISPNTVKRHLAEIKKKLEIASRNELKQYMLR